MRFSLLLASNVRGVDNVNNVRNIWKICDLWLESGMN